LSGSFLPAQDSVEILRDRWGIAHIYATAEPGGFYGAGYATAADRLLQMDLFRRRAKGLLAEVYGARFVESDRKFRVAGLAQHCEEAAALMPADMLANLRAYAAGVNAWVAANPDAAARRMAPLGAPFAPWTAADCLCSWYGVAEIFDRLYDEGAIQMYDEFRKLAAAVGEEKALAERGMMIDDAAAVVPESEMARNAEVYARLKARPKQPGFWQRSLPDDLLRFSHAWAVDGSRTPTGKPLLESDPQTSVNNPALWYEFHLSAGRYNVRGIGFAGSPAFLIGFNDFIAWGGSALGAGSGVTFLEKLSPDGAGYLYRGATESFTRRVETIQVKGAEPIRQEVLRTRHGFVFNPLVPTSVAGHVFVSHYQPIEDRGTSLVGLLNMMGAANWGQFREAMEWYYSPGLHIVYADREGHVGYQTLNYVPLTRRTPRLALEGWTGEDEVRGRIPLDEMPNLLNPESRFVSHANNLPVGSWYPFDLGISTGGIGHTSRSLRLLELLDNKRLFTADSFETAVHRDDVQSAVAALFPVARRLAQETEITDRNLQGLLDSLKDWDLRYRATQPTYPGAVALSGAMLLSYRRSGLGARLGGGEGGIAHLARLLRDQFSANRNVPQDPEVRESLMTWLRAAAADYPRQVTALAPQDGKSRRVHAMPYQANGPLGFPTLDARLDLTSPPLDCGEVGTIWSQAGNSYTQIVDLDDPDNSRTLLPPGLSEDPDSPHHTDQVALWVRGGVHPAPLSRHRVEEITAQRLTLPLPRPPQP
jgi:penicillin amidase